MQLRGIEAYYQSIRFRIDTPYLMPPTYNKCRYEEQDSNAPFLLQMLIIVEDVVIHYNVYLCAIHKDAWMLSA